MFARSALTIALLALLAGPLIAETLLLDEPPAPPASSQPAQPETAVAPAASAPPATAPPAVSKPRPSAPPAAALPPRVVSQSGLVECANLIYGQNKSSVCFSDHFLTQLAKETNIQTNRRFMPVKLDSPELYNFPFAIMTGEGAFTLTDEQRANLRNYLMRGGFLLASAGCSSSQWSDSFRAEIRKIFPESQYALEGLDSRHAMFHTIYDINGFTAKHTAKAAIEGLHVNGRLVLVYSELGLNDTPNAGPGCCCCGGNEIRNARDINVNILAYALTH